MASKLAFALLHLLMFALVCAVGAYWGVRILTPLPTAAPPPATVPPPRDPDPMLVARMFGLVQQAPVKVAANIQVAGVFAAGKYSSAVLVIDGKPARAYALDQEIVSGSRLVGVGADHVTIEGEGGARQEVKVPPRPVATSAAAAAPAFVREGNRLSPSANAPASAARPGTDAPAAPQPPAQPPARQPQAQPQPPDE